MNNRYRFTHKSEASSHHHHSDEEVILASARPKKRAGRRVFKETRHPVYRGVRRRNNNKWVCEMRVPNNNKSRIWLGTYPTPEMAARAHDVAALALRGKSACLNFADSAWRLSLPVSTDAEAIRKAAVEAAEAFAAELDNQQQHKNNVKSSSSSSTDHHYEDVCSVGDRMVMEDANKVKPLQQEEMYVDEVAGVSEFEDLHDLLLRIADEPLRSPPPFARDGGDWNDVEIFDAEVSLWSFSF
uniref:DREB group protein n=1 Tax=Ammopiptanthus mongolicus TaxID=126911 RepID=W5ZSI5_AMMMO|nr:DREB group protein [Ammopiptanthus mongolicus]